MLYKTQQYELGKLQFLLVEDQCAKYKQATEKQLQALAQQARSKHANKLEADKKERHLTSPTGVGAVGKEPSAATRISSSVSSYFQPS